MDFFNFSALLTNSKNQSGTTQTRSSRGLVNPAFPNSHTHKKKENLMEKINVHRRPLWKLFHPFTDGGIIEDIYTTKIDPFGL